MSRDLSLTVNIVAPPTTILGNIASKMIAGEWVYLDGGTRTVGTTPNVLCAKPSGIDAALGLGIDGVLPYAHKVHWNPRFKTIEMIGRDHGGPPYPNQWSRYHETNQNGQPAHSVEARRFQQTGDGAPNDLGWTHNFDKQAVNPFTGEIIVGLYNSCRNVTRWTPPADPVWNPVTEPVINFVPHQSNLYAPFEWWYGPTLGNYEQGLFLVWAEDGAGNKTQSYIDAYDPVSNQWVWSAPTGVWCTGSGGDTYNRISAYSRVKNIMLFGGGNQSSTSLWKIDQNRVITRLPDLPVIDGIQLRVGVAIGNLIADPVTGKFLLLGPAGTHHFWEFDPDANGGTGQWTRLPDAPSAIRTPGTSLAHVTLPEHGITAWISTYITMAWIHLYKHA